MNASNFRILKMLILALAFVSLFWQEKLGLNIVLFTLLVIPTLREEFRDSWNSRVVIFTTITTVLSAILIMINNSLLSIFVYLSSFIAMVGFVHQHKLNSLYQAFFLTICNTINTPFQTADLVKDAPLPAALSPSKMRKVLTSIVPVGVISFFYFIYYVANPNFANLSDQFWSQFSWISQFDISWPITLFFLIGLIIGFVLLFPTRLDEAFGLMGQEESLKRKRGKKKRLRGMIGLKNQLSIGHVLLVCLNALLLIVNSIDVWYVWLRNQNVSPSILSRDVHQGTYMLIVAIILSMGVSLFFFRKNINFLTGNKFIKKLSYLWLAQNAVLALSVFARNIHYIEYYGLAYKRIGVIVFLLMVLSGLFSVYYKIAFKKNFRFLINKNVWSVFVILFIASFINWDILISKYNIHSETHSHLDVQFLSKKMTDKNLYLLFENKDLILAKRNQSHGYQDQRFVENIEKTRDRFLKEQEQYSWLSWNYADYKNKQAFSSMESN